MNCKHCDPINAGCMLCEGSGAVPACPWMAWELDEEKRAELMEACAYAKQAARVEDLEAEVESLEERMNEIEQDAAEGIRQARHQAFMAHQDAQVRVQRAEDEARYERRRAEDRR